MLLLDINDTEIALSRDGAVLYAEPGIALVERGKTLFGSEAMAQSRLHPRQTHSEFWQRLNADPVAPAGRGVANQADLVYQHLRHILAAAGLRKGELVVAAPSTVTPNQLGLLLGIAAEADIQVRAVVDAAVAAASTQPLDGGCRFVDVAMHRAYVTELEVQGDSVSRVGVEEVPAAGFAALVEGWVDAVADNFVQGTRFDPLRIAATEQQVFDQLLTRIESDDAEFAIAVEHDGVSREATIGRRALLQKAEQRFGLLTTAIGLPTTLLISHRARRLPGLAASLQEAGHRIVACPDDSVASAVEINAPLFAPDAAGARLITSLDLPAPPTAAESARRPDPTHLLCGGLAVAIADGLAPDGHPGGNGSAAGFRIDRDAAGFRIVPSADGTEAGAARIRMNGEPLDFERPAGVGDRIESGSAVFHLIAVVDR